MAPLGELQHQLAQGFVRDISRQRVSFGQALGQRHVAGEGRVEQHDFALGVGNHYADGQRIDDGVGAALLDGKIGQGAQFFLL